MKKFFLDTSALLCLRDDEPGADRVAELLRLAQAGQTQCLGCFITLILFSSVGTTKIRSN